MINNPTNVNKTNNHLSPDIIENTEGTIKNGQSRETGNIDEEKQSKNTTQYALDTTMHKQSQIT
jgi:hypothetical protein